MNQRGDLMDCGCFISFIKLFSLWENLLIPPWLSADGFHGTEMTIPDVVSDNHLKKKHH